MTDRVFDDVISPGRVPDDGIGAPLRRFEDRRFLTGTASYVSDFSAPDALHACFVRSMHAHAHIREIDVTAARAG
jgi:carbon-monoxide dehydrogenase large subunit